MLSFKQYLIENSHTVEFAKKWVSKWLAACSGNLAKYKNEIGNCDFQNNGDVIYHGNLYILDDDFLDENKEIPLQVQVCRRFQISATNISSFKNCPKELSGYSQEINDWVFLLRPVFGNKEEFTALHSLEGITPIMNGHINLAMAPNLSYSRVDKHLKEINGNLRINGQYVGPLLSLLKIKNLESVSVGANPNQKTEQACEIVTKHCRNKSRDILACQIELIENDLEEYAQL